jgi:Family of unknown function (DUF6776)
MRKLLRRLRQHFGIAAPRLAVSPHVAWYWRALRVVVVLSISGALALWMYDAGRRFAGYDRGVLDEEMQHLRARVAELEDELPKLRAIADSSDARLKIEQTAERNLARQLRELEANNARLKEDIAFFENLSAQDHAEDRVTVARFKVESNVIPGEYRYRVLVMQGGSRPREFSGRLQFIVTMQRDRKDVMLVIPDETSEPQSAYQITFKRFYRADGVFRVDPSAKVRSVQVRLLEKGSGQPRATQSYSLS